jgi:predicted HTH domain antitoxin
MKTLKINLPESVDFDANDALMVIAARLYDKGKITLGQAAQMVGLSKTAFMELLANYGVAVFNYDISAIDKDIENAKDYSI